MHGESHATLRARVLETGTQLGRYTIVRRIGSGGMAELYLARARGIAGFDKLVALKLVLPHVADDPEFVSMFLDEARLAATLDHANIVHVLDIGRVGDDHFYAMEYIHGLDLRAICRRVIGPMPLDVALTIVLGVAAGLHHAHERRGRDGRPLGIVHRDVSPSNVLVTFDGVVKLVDFGIARAEARSKATQAGVVKGKRGYMSPEQCRADAVDRRSDVFGLGILLWELTVGQRLFASESDYAAMSKIVFGMVPDPRQLVPGYPDALAEIAMAALRRDADGRPATVQVLAVQLERFMQAMCLRTSNHLLAEFIALHFAVEPYPTSVPDVGGAATATLPIPVRAPGRARGLALVGLATAGAAAALVAAWVLGGAGAPGPATPREDPTTALGSIAPGSPHAGAEVPAPAVAPQDVIVPLAEPPDSVTPSDVAADAPQRGDATDDERVFADDDEEPVILPERPADRTRPRPPPIRPRPAPGTSAHGGAPVPSRPNALFPPRE